MATIVQYPQPFTKYVQFQGTQKYYLETPSSKFIMGL